MSTEIVTTAFLFATAAHEGQTVKGTNIPYISHPMHVAAIVWEFGGTPEQVAAAFLHDVVEDTDHTIGDIEKEFGPLVAKIVGDCTDSNKDPKPPWRPRKEAYLKHIRDDSDAASILVSLADKFHNVNRILNDLLFLRGNEEKLWSLFTAPPDQIAWYYNGLVSAFLERQSRLTPGEKAACPKLGTLLRKFQIAVYDLEGKISLTLPENYRLYHVDGFDHDSEDTLWRTFKTYEDATRFATAYVKLICWSSYFHRAEEVKNPSFDKTALPGWADYLVVRYKDGNLMFSTDDLKAEHRALPTLSDYRILDANCREEDRGPVEELKSFIEAIRI